MTNSSGTYYYAHDQLYSPIVLVNSSGGIEDRYEYDAYGACRVLNADYTVDADGRPDCGNPYLFTGREVDYLDSGSLPLQYNRHRYYLQGMGRWTSEDPLAIDPAGGLHLNRFFAITQYKDGLDLYEYARSEPVRHYDSYGLAACGCYVKRLVKEVMNSKTVHLDNPYGHEWLVCGDNSWGWESKGAGTVSPEWYQTAGRDRWKFGDIKMWKVEKRFFGSLRFGTAAGTKCRCASCEDITSCLDAFTAWAPANRKYKNFLLDTMNPFAVYDCRSYVSESLDMCCLRKGGQVPHRAEHEKKDETWTPGVSDFFI